VQFPGAGGVPHVQSTCRKEARGFSLTGFEVRIYNCLCRLKKGAEPITNQGKCECARFQIKADNNYLSNRADQKQSSQEGISQLVTVANCARLPPPKGTRPSCPTLRMRWLGSFSHPSANGINIIELRLRRPSM